MTSPKNLRDGWLVLADGTRFPGQVFGAAGPVTGEAVFTTSMTGYQEVLTDPSYCGQIVCMTSPHIGNTGVTKEDDEAVTPFLAGFVVHAATFPPSSWRSEGNLDAFLKNAGIVGITQVDTRALTRAIRDGGAQMAAIGSLPSDELHALAKRAPGMEGQDLTANVSTKSAYEWSQGSGEWTLTRAGASRFTRRPRVVALDYGIKRNILRCLVDVGCDVTVLPSSASAADVLSRSPDGIFLSNGPGDPAAAKLAINTVRDLIGKKPMFGICLGHQLLALALGGKTYKLKFGHRGLNQPVKDLATGRVEITTQNHGFCVDLESLPKGTRLSHVHLNDGTCEGFANDDARLFAVQYHPEAGAGPHDSRYLFERFVSAITV